MLYFDKNIRLEQLGLTNNCKIREPFSFCSKLYHIEVIVGHGFITDLGSIPSILKSFVRASEARYWRAFVIHDALYRILYSRKKADLILDEALKVLGGSAYMRYKIYYGLRMFGSVSKDKSIIDNARATIEII